MVLICSSEKYACKRERKCHPRELQIPNAYCDPVRSRDERSALVPGTRRDERGDPARSVGHPAGHGLPGHEGLRRSRIFFGLGP